MSTATIGARSGRSRGGFMLAEPAVLIVMVGVVSAFGVPRVLNSVERARAAEAFAYFSALQAAQEHYRVEELAYARDLDDLDMPAAPPASFALGAIAVVEGDEAPSWTCTLTRLSARPEGAYTLTFTQDGFSPARSTIASLPEIAPRPRLGRR